MNYKLTIMGIVVEVRKVTRSSTCLSVHFDSHHEDLEPIIQKFKRLKTDEKRQELYNKVQRSGRFELGIAGAVIDGVVRDEDLDGNRGVGSQEGLHWWLPYRFQSTIVYQYAQATYEFSIERLMKQVPEHLHDELYCWMMTLEETPQGFIAGDGSLSSRRSKVSGWWWEFKRSE